MSGYTLTSGQRTVTHATYCPICHVRRELTPANLSECIGYAPPQLLCCTKAHMHKYCDMIQDFLIQATSVEEALKLWHHSWVGILPESLMERVQGGIDG